MNYKVIGSTVSASALGVGLVLLCWFVSPGDREARALNYALVVFGVSLGWLTGILVSPYDPKEASAFPKYVAGASAFASGYLLSKLDRVLEEVLRPDFLFTPVTGFRLIAVVSAFALALVVTYVYRTYAR